ncbi:DUF899 domain-containing protein [Solimonas sp. K1W22B-7]|uniref:DUF899 domain-containing protein n=1 Tax=Solimonas sp. K1W22B-7 TaxID=2303331 RepID=UPI000E32E9FF|nr:thioredoxin family protein [Solimonas sp. K1W22B-7]AXQ30634.1 DUF899 domain-containing protein [Solimonas sp. K1W22B-7]
MPHEIVSREQWLEASRALLAEEKSLTHVRDRLAEKRRALPWVRVEKDYVFQTPEGPRTLAQLFDGRSQLIVYHFMFGPAWEEGCPGCSLLCDQVDGARQHFEHNDVSWVAVSRGPLAKLQAYRRRMGWGFRWVSSAESDFNFDYQVSYPEGTRADGVDYNFEKIPDPGVDELPGVSVFHRDDSGAIFHTYSSFARGGEMFLPVYAWLDIVPKGRNEGGDNMGHWMRRHDEYPDDGRRAAPTAQSCCGSAAV